MKTKTKETEYEMQATGFVVLTGITITKTYIGHSRRFGDTPTAQFDITIEREGKKPWTFAFNISINDSYETYDPNRKMITRWESLGDVGQRYLRMKGFDATLRRGGFECQGVKIRQAHPSPTNYDILACLGICYADSFAEFCEEFGYDTDSIKARDIYIATQDETAAMRRLFTEAELEQLHDIN